MDALSFDYMLPEYENKAKDAEMEGLDTQVESVPPSSPSKDEPRNEEFDYEEDVGGVETVEVSQLVPDAPEGSKDAPSGSTSSSNNSIQENSSIGGGSQSFYLPSVMSPSVSYEKDFPDQELIAVFGRQFDRPDVISQRLQRLLSTDKPSTPSARLRAKFLPFTMKRKALMKGTYSSAELKKHSLICMCYNASEARILLTGVDGFYSSLLRHVEAVLGGCFVEVVLGGCYS